MKYFMLLFAALFSTLCACSSDNEPTPPPTPEPTRDAFYKGADISWLTEMEADGVKFYYDDGRQGDCIDILKGKGMNIMRLRVWVDPENGYNALSDVLAKARRINAAGLDLMIDFHYSDSWADPGQQTVPKAWEKLDVEGLKKAIFTHTTNLLTTLKKEGINVRFVQVGNETGNGMLWPLGKADTHPRNYADFITAGYEGVKAIYPQAKVIVHLHNGWDNALFRWNIDILTKYDAKYDIIGMSLYPEPDNYVEYVDKCAANMADMIARYRKEVMLCEVGIGAGYQAQCLDFLTRCIDLRSTFGNAYLGVLYWEPQCYNDWHGYAKGAFTSAGRPGPQLAAFTKEIKL